MGTTTHGLPYPEPTDPVAAGAAAIRSLAESIDTPCGGKWRRVTAMSVGSGGTITFTWDTEDADSDNFHTPGPGNGFILIPAGKGGVYSISGSLGFAAGPGTNSFARLVLPGQTFDFPATPVGQQAGFNATARLVPGDQIITQVFQATGAAMGIGGFIHVNRVAL